MYGYIPSRMGRATVTVVMPAHNVEPYIAAAIRSVLAQTFTDFELWVLENGSTDRTGDIAAEFTDPRVKVFRLGPVGFQGALSYALEHAKTQWIARMDSDDVCHPARLQRQMDVVREHPDYVAVGTGFAMLTPAGHIVQSEFPVPSRELNKASIALGGYRADQPRGRISADPSMLFDRNVALAVGGYDSAFTMGDVPLWLRMLDGHKGWEIAEPLYMYRMRSDSLKSKHLEGVEVRKKYAPELLDGYMQVNYEGAATATQRTLTGYWRRVGYLELLAGDRRAALQASKALEQAGNRRSAYVMRLRAHASRFGGYFNDPGTQARFRHRPDLEQQLASFI